MTRTYTRKTPVVAAPVVAAAPAIPALSRPIVVDASMLEIPDLPLLMRLQAVDPNDQAAMQAAIVEATPMLCRLVVGGLVGYKIAELPAVVVEVFNQLGTASNPKN